MNNEDKKIVEAIGVFTENLRKEFLSLQQKIESMENKTKWNEGSLCVNTKIHRIETINSDNIKAARKVGWKAIARTCAPPNAAHAELVHKKRNAEICFYDQNNKEYSDYRIYYSPAKETLVAGCDIKRMEEPK